MSWLGTTAQSSTWCLEFMVSGALSWAYGEQLSDTPDVAVEGNPKAGACQVNRS